MPLFPEFMFSLACRTIGRKDCYAAMGALRSDLTIIIDDHSGAPRAPALSRQRRRQVALGRCGWPDPQRSRVFDEISW